MITSISHAARPAIVPHRPQRGAQFPVVVAVVALVSQTACVDFSVPESLEIRCGTGDDCPADRVCRTVGSAGLCVEPSAPCTIVIDRTARTATAAADGVACSDGRICSAGACVVPVCGDGVDFGEACDDGNDNPRDGCDQCRTQRWGMTLQVAGSIEGRAATDANVLPRGVAVDGLGRVYVSDQDRHRVLRLNPDGTVTTIAGTGSEGFSGDGGPATSAALATPSGIAVDAFGRVFIAETDNHRVRRIDLDGTIATIAGTGDNGLSGDGPATSAALSSPLGVAVDAAGHVFIADNGNHRVCRVDVDGTMTTIAGTGDPGFSGDDGPATDAELFLPSGVAVDAAGHVFVADSGNHRIRRIDFDIDVDGTITTIAGTGEDGFSGDGGPATLASINFPHGVVVDGAGRVVIADTANHRIRRVDVDGTITTIAGTGEDGFSGDGGSATGAALWRPSGVAVDADGRVLIADFDNRRIRTIDVDGNIATIAGTGLVAVLNTADPAKSAAFRDLAGIAIDATGRIFVADGGNGQVHRVDVDGTITTIAGTGQWSFAGDGGPATSAGLSSPVEVAFDGAGRILIADNGNNRVRRVDLDGTITTIAGTGESGFSGDGGPATEAALFLPSGVAVDASGRVLIADTLNHRVRRVDVDGTITTIAGTGEAGFSVDGIAATSAALSEPFDVAVDAAGRVVIADSNNHRVRRVELDGTIVTIAGTRSAGFSGDGGPATLASLRLPQGVVVDGAGRVVIADTANHRIRRIEDDQTITTIAGTGEPGLSGDGGPATGAMLRNPQDVTVDASGRVVIADTNNDVVRRVENDGTITTLAGLVHPPGPGLLDSAKLYAPAALVPLAAATLVSVGELGRALRIDDDGVDVVVGYEQASASASGQARFAPLLNDARGVAFDPVALTLVITEHGTGNLRTIGLDPDGNGVIDDAAAWTSAHQTPTLSGPAGIAYDAGSDTFVVADEADHCIQRVDHDGVVLETVFGRCGAPGVFSGFLNDPTHVVVSPSSGAVYVADTGNHRVLRVDANGDDKVVVGDGSVSSAGEGSPARLFPVNAPRQLALDDFGNLYVASTTTLRLVANVDGDDDADGDDRVTTIFGGGERLVFPESDTFCLGALTVDGEGDVYAADACQGYMVRLSPVVD